MPDYLINEETLNNLGDAIRTLSGDNSSMSPAQMINNINETKSAINALEEHKVDTSAHEDIRAIATAAQTAANQAKASADSASSFSLIMSKAWNKIQSYETAGTYTFTVPDLFGGKPYKLGYMIIGGGGGGSAGSVTGKYYVGATGGCSGFSTYGVVEVTPGQTKSVVIGAGGTGASAAAGSGTPTTGGNGGSSSFDGNSAAGGSAGVTYYKSNTGSSTYALPGTGGQVSHMVSGYGVPNGNIEPFGGTIILEKYTSSSGTLEYHTVLTDVLSCFNPFEQTRMLSAGGSSVVLCMNSTYYSGKSNGGRGAGNGVANASTAAATATSATVAGCGGGSATSCGGAAKAGNGAPGAVYLYVMGG